MQEMNNENKHINWDERIARYLAGEANASEIKELEVWVKEDQGHAQLFNEMRTAWQLSSVAQHAQAEIDTEAALSDLLNRIDAKAETKTRTLNMRTFLRYAAVFVAIVAIGYVFYWYSDLGTKESYVAENKIVETVLPDGSAIALNQNSRLVHNKKDESVRKVKLEGEAFFNVERMPSKPFIVETQELIVEVLGTSFYVNSTEGSNFTEVVVESGSVSVSDKNSRVVLSAGEKVRYNKSKPELIKEGNEDPNFLSWKTNVYRFDNSTLQVVINTLKDDYRFSVGRIDPRVKNCTITVVFDKRTKAEILRILEETLDLEITTGKNGIVISGEGC